ncbi:MAG: hypothetical protein R3A80_12850 [Bdellovibrionota bacterium]
MKRILASFFFVLSAAASAAIFSDVAAHKKLELAPELYQEMYSYWREQYELTRFALEELELEKRPALEVPYFYSYKERGYAFDPGNEKEPYLAIEIGPPRFSLSSLRWLGMLNLLKSATTWERVLPKRVQEVAQFLEKRALEKRDLFESFAVFEAGLGPEDFQYFKDALAWERNTKEYDVRVKNGHILNLRREVVRLDAEIRLLTDAYGNVTYDPDLKYRVDYAYNYIQRTSYYSYYALNADLAYLNDLRRQMNDDYAARSEKHIALRSKRSEVLNKAQTEEQELLILQSEVHALGVKSKRVLETVSDFEKELREKYIQWGHKGDPFKRDKYQEAEFRERYVIDQLFSLGTESEVISLNFWQRQKQERAELLKLLKDFQKVCDALDKGSNVTASQMPESLVDHDDASLALMTKRHYIQLKQQLEKLHNVHFEAMVKLYEHFRDPDAYLKNLIHWNQ